MKFLVFVFWCIVIFYVLGWIGRVMLRGWVRSKEREFAARAQAAGQRVKQQQRASQPEGRVTVERTEVKEKHVSGKVGEYVEFEEVKE